MKLEFSRQFFEKYSNVKFLEDPSNGSQVAPYGRSDMMKLSLFEILRTRLKLCFVRMCEETAIIFLYSIN